jgi:hypothetical protein
MAKSKQKELICNVGDRITAPGGKTGTVIEVKTKGMFPYIVRWDNNIEAPYKGSDFEKYSYKIECSNNSISAQGSASDSPSQRSSLEDLPLLAYANVMSTVEKSSLSDSQVSQSVQMSQPWTAHTSQSKSLQRRHRANRSQSKGKGKGQQMRETAFQPLLERSQVSNHDTLQLKMFTDSSAAPTSQEVNNSTLSGCLEKFTCAGMMRSGLVSPAGTLVAPLLDDGCLWLESPGALSLSGQGRPPGQSKLEAQLRAIGAIALQEVVNPIFLEDAFKIPMGWSDPLECRAATTLLEEGEKHSVTVSIPELQQLDLREFSISTASSQTDDDLTPKQMGKQTGSLYQYTANRTGKDGVIREYPLVEGRDRDRAEDKDWYWGISYVEKVRGKWCDRSASVPRWSLPLARRLMSNDFPVLLTIEACQLKWLWTTEMSTYLIGEVRPEVCPRLAILSFEDKEVFITGSSWGELSPPLRMTLRAKIQKAIAERKPFSYIKEILR